MVREVFSEEVKLEDFTSGKEKEMFCTEKWYVQRRRTWPVQGLAGVIKGI